MVGPEFLTVVMDMLSDPEARRPMFGYELPADLPYKVVVKTGTARGFADTVALFATRERIVAAWTGRLDGGPTKGVYGMKGAAPLARDGLLLAADGRRLTLTSKPDTVVAVPVCPLSGKRPGPACPHRMVDYAIEDRIPEETCDWHQMQGGKVVTHYPEEIRAYTERHARKLALR